MTEKNQLAHASDAELLAWLDGVQDGAQHIVECEECQRRALALHIEERRLHGLFYRAECPSALTLAEYGAGFLSKEERKAVDEHIAHCPLCSQELAWQRQFMATLASQPQESPQRSDLLREVKESVRIIVAQWINKASQGPGIGVGMQFAMGAMRGQSKRPMLFNADELQVTLEFYEDAANPGKHQLVGLLVGEEMPERFQVQLWHGRNCVAEASVDELGNFVIDNLPPAKYDLKLIHPKLEIQLNALEI